VAAKSIPQHESLMRKYSIKLASTSSVRLIIPLLANGHFFFLIIIKKRSLDANIFCKLNCFKGYMDGYTVAFHRLDGCYRATPKSIARSQGGREGKKEVKKNFK
jgi:hypothetical protein